MTSTCVLLDKFCQFITFIPVLFIILHYVIILMKISIVNIKLSLLLLLFFLGHLSVLILQQVVMQSCKCYDIHIIYSVRQFIASLI